MTSATAHRRKQSCDREGPRERRLPERGTDDRAGISRDRFGHGIAS